MDSLPHSGEMVSGISFAVCSLGGGGSNLGRPRTMSAGIYPPLLLAILLFAVVVVSCITYRQMRSSTALSAVWFAVALAPSVVQLVLFYSLAIHMRHSLGRWPTSIGGHGFSPGLLAHANVAVTYWECFILATVIAWPIAYILCLVISSWRQWSMYLGAYFLSCIPCIGIMLLAPGSFLNWWWD